MQNLRQPTIKITPKEYSDLSKTMTPRPSVVRNSIRAFWVGGSICALGQVMVNSLVLAGMALGDAQTTAVASLIFIGAVLTGLGVYDEIVKYAGAGGIVPVTGFANSMVAPALEYKREGYVLGVGARLFTVAGPVLVNGISAAVIVGIIYYLIS